MITRKHDYKLLISAPTIDALEKAINKFYYSNNYKILNVFDNEYVLINDNKSFKDKYFIKNKRNRFYFYKIVD